MPPIKSDVQLKSLIVQFRSETPIRADGISKARPGICRHWRDSTPHVAPAGICIHNLLDLVLRPGPL
eukprot:scaffold431351_cov19-Prasinocladus_malaysianus.AAC.1